MEKARIQLDSEELLELADILAYELSDRVLDDKPVPNALKTAIVKIKEAQTRLAEQHDRTTD